MIMLGSIKNIRDKALLLKREGARRHPSWSAPVGTAE